METHRLIRTNAGIGDCAWILMKLINTGEKFDFHLSDGFPQRGKQIFDMLPQVTNSCEYVPGLSYKTIRETSKQYDTATWASIDEKSFSLSCNHHLEQGRRIEEFLPDLKITFELPYMTGQDGANFYRENQLMPDLCIGIYTSAYNTSRQWGLWNERQWFDFIQKIYAEKPEAVFYIIGAQWDIDLSKNLMQLLEENHIPFVDTIGRNLGYVIELLRSLDYFIGFPSGLSILNETLHKKTMMFYPYHLKDMMYAWAELDRIKNHQYIALLPDTPQGAFNVFADQSGIL